MIALFRRPLRSCCLVALVVLVAARAAAQTGPTPTPDPDPTITSAYTNITLRSGPGTTFAPLGTLRAGLAVRIIERNRIGTWVHVTNGRDLDGWVLSGFLNLAPGLRYSQIPESSLPDADLTNVSSRTMAELYAVPVIPTISPAMRAVYERGQALGNHASVVTKIGDSVCANPMYLVPMSQADYQLGPYDYLEATIRFFGPSLAVASVAARSGMTTYVIFDPLWADKSVCQPNESPLDCEFRLKKPSAAFIMFGPNDVRHMTHDSFDVQMRQLVERTLELGIIPVLTTFSADPEAEFFAQSLNFNARLTRIAAEYEVPIINLWAAARVLPDYGLDIDAVHMKNSGFRYLNFDSGNEAWYGVALQNLLSIRTLDELRRTLDMN